MNSLPVARVRISDPPFQNPPEIRASKCFFLKRRG